MKTTQRNTTSGPIVVKIDKRLSALKTEGAFKEKLEKAAKMLPLAGAQKK